MESHIPSLPNEKDLQALLLSQARLKNLMDNIRKSMVEITEADEENPKQSINKEIANEINKFFDSLVVTLNSVINCVCKIDEFIDFYAKTEVENKVREVMNPHLKKIFELENLVRLMSENSKAKDERLLELMEGQETMNKDLVVFKGMLTNIERMLRDKGNNSNNLGRSSTPFGDITNFQINKDIKLPTFSNDARDKPMKFLSELREYLEAHPNSDLKVTINNSLRGCASDWWHIVRNDVNSRAQFFELFENTYWSEGIKDEYEKKLRFGRYDYNQDRTSCVQYATHLAAIASDLGYLEAQYMSKISKLFSNDVKNLIQGTPNKTFAILLEKLNECDNEIKIKKRKQMKLNTPPSSSNGYRVNNNNNYNNGRSYGNENNGIRGSSSFGNNGNIYRNNNARPAYNNVRGNNVPNNENNQRGRTNNDRDQRREIQAIVDFHAQEDVDLIEEIQSENA